MADDYLGAILQGQLPSELDTVFQKFRPDVFAAFLTAAAHVVAMSHMEMRYRYAPTVMPQVMDADLRLWLKFHLMDSIELVRTTNPQLDKVEHEAVNDMVDSLSDVVMEMLRQQRQMDDSEMDQ